MLKRYGFAVFVFLFLLFTGRYVHSQYYKDYTDAERKELADAYYLAGKAYESFGNPLGKYYIRMARVIYPQFNPDLIGTDDLKGLSAFLNGEQIQ